MQNFVHMRLILEDEARRTAGGGDFRGHRLFGIRTTHGALDGANAALLDELGVAAQLAARKVLGIDAPTAAGVEQITPLLQSQGQRCANGL